MRLRQSFAKALCVAGLFHQAGAVQANEVPQDLKQLLGQWQSVPKQPNASDFIELTTVSLTDDASTMWNLVASELEHVRSQDAVPTLFKFSSPQADVRKEIMDSLSPDKNKDAKLCDAFSYKEFKPRSGTAASDPEKLKETARKKRTQECKQHLDKIFGGLFHANPKVKMVKVDTLKEGQAGRELVIYMPSIIEPTMHLRYAVTVN